MLHVDRETEGLVECTWESIRMYLFKHEGIERKTKGFGWEDRDMCRSSVNQQKTKSASMAFTNTSQYGTIVPEGHSIHQKYKFVFCLTKNWSIRV